MKKIISRAAALITLGTLTLSLSGCFLLPKEEEVLAPPLKEPPKITYSTIDVKKSVFERKIDCNGYFVPTRQKDLCFRETSGRLKGIYVKTGDKVEKGALLAELVTDDIDDQIRQEEILVKKVQMQYDLTVASAASKFDIERASLDVEAEKIKLDSLKKKQAQSRIIAPEAGVVDYVADVKDGETVDAFKNLVRLANSGELQLQYGEDNVSSFQLGMQVQVTIGTTVYNGKVVANPPNSPSDASDEQKSYVRIQVDQLPKTVGIGDSANITLVQVHKENAIVIPKGLIHTLGTRKYVNILENGVKREVDIEVGEENMTESEVIKGLVVGDKLIKD